MPTKPIAKGKGKASISRSRSKPKSDTVKMPREDLEQLGAIVESMFERYKQLNEFAQRLVVENEKLRTAYLRLR